MNKLYYVNDFELKLGGGMPPVCDINHIEKRKKENWARWFEWEKRDLIDSRRDGGVTMYPGCLGISQHALYMMVRITWQDEANAAPAHCVIVTQTGSRTSV